MPIPEIGMAISPLILAAQNRHGSEVVRVLPEFGADADMINDQLEAIQL